MTWDDVRALALALPGATEGTLYHKPAFRVTGKAFAWESPHEHGVLALRCDIDERPLMIESRPEMFFVTPHYEAHPIVLVRLDGADADELGGRIEDSWFLTAPPRLADAYAAD